MDSYFQVRDAERTAWFTSQEVRNIADVAAMVTKALDAAGGEGETSVPSTCGSRWNFPAADLRGSFQRAGAGPFL